jgi:hypothetical protein
MVEPAAIRALIDELRFDEAEELIREADAESGKKIGEEIARLRAEAEGRANALAQRLVELGEERQMADLVEIAHQPSTQPLLSLLSESSRKRPELFVREALRWEEKRRETNARRLAEARKALDGLDLELAGGLMNRIDGRFLSEAQVEERDQLLLDISARTMELESLDRSGDHLIGEKESPPHAGNDQPWWRRWFG